MPQQGLFFLTKKVKNRQRWFFHSPFKRVIILLT